MNKILFVALLLLSNLAYSQQNTYSMLGDTVFHEIVVYSPDEYDEDQIMLHYLSEAGMGKDTESSYDMYVKQIFEGKALFPVRKQEVVVMELWIIKFNSSNTIKQN